MTTVILPFANLDGYVDPNMNQFLLPEYLRRSDNSHYIKALKRELLLGIEEELTETQREFIRKRYFGGESLAQIASEYGCNLPTVSKAVKRAENNLRRRMEYFTEMYKRIERDLISAYA